MMMVKLLSPAAEKSNHKHFKIVIFKLTSIIDCIEMTFNYSRALFTTLNFGLVVV